MTLKTIIIHALILTMNREKEVFSNGFLVLEDTVITDLGSMESLAQNHPFYPDGYEVIDGKGKILIPGMINTHTHMGMIPFRGLGDDCPDRLRTFLFPMEQKAMDAQMVGLSTAYAAGEMLLAGTTTVFDMYYFEEEAAKSLDKMGMRAIAAETVIDKDSCDYGNPMDAMAYGEELMKKYQNHPRIQTCVAPHGTTTCSSLTLQKAHALNNSYKRPFSLHTAEMDYEMAFFRDQYQMTPVEYLDSIGVLDEYTLAAHCIYMTDHDLELMEIRKGKVAHCIGSNTKAAKGVAPVRQMLNHHIPVGLGTDGPASGNTLDLFTQMKLFANFHKTTNKDRSMFPANEIVELATIGGARALNLDGITGSLEVGKQADLVLVETDSPNMFPLYDPYSALVYSAQASNVFMVFVAGKCLVDNHKLVLSDMDQLGESLKEKILSSDFKDYMINYGN